MTGKERSSTEARPVPLRQAPASRVSGKMWKSSKAPVRRSQRPSSLNRTFAQRMEEKKKNDIAKGLERMMREEKEAEKQRKKEIREEREKAKAEKERLERLASVLSAKKLQRIKRKQLKKRS
ncbi:MAG: hypothetical protein DHS80DRAFT_26085 [Piptocephalis tieghemiana]|nr:MAG: hypothetical protein DHS80DRAFT_26085 [Piptocephalis tieghemiana]